MSNKTSNIYSNLVFSLFDNHKQDLLTDGPPCHGPNLLDDDELLAYLEDREIETSGGREQWIAAYKRDKLSKFSVRSNKESVISCLK